MHVASNLLTPLLEQVGTYRIRLDILDSPKKIEHEQGCSEQTILSLHSVTRTNTLYSKVGHAHVPSGRSTLISLEGLVFTDAILSKR